MHAHYYIDKKTFHASNQVVKESMDHLLDLVIGASLVVIGTILPSSGCGSWMGAPMSSGHL